MSIRTKDYLVSRFETSDIPTQEDFTDLIDTLETHSSVVEQVLIKSSSVWEDVNNMPSFEYQPRMIMIFNHGGDVYLFNAPVGEYGQGSSAVSEANFKLIHKDEFTESQQKKILDLIYENSELSFMSNINIFEKGVDTQLDYTYNIIPNDDIVTKIYTSFTSDIDLSNADGISHNVDNMIVDDSVTNRLTINYTKNSIALSKYITVTTNSYIPMFSGVSITEDYNGVSVADLELELTKHVKSSSSIDSEVSPTNQYVWFISNKATAEIYDQNDFKQTVGVWGDNASEFYTKSASIVLANGNIDTTYLYRSRLPKTLTDFTYKIR